MTGNFIQKVDYLPVLLVDRRSFRSKFKEAVMLNFLGLLVSSFFYLCAYAAGPSVHAYKVNGLDVYLINTHVGNGVALMVNIQEGSWHDEPTKHAGRSHLFEHVIHSGSLKYPGREAFDAQIKKIGGSYNAYTSHNRVFFHAYIHPEAFAEAASVLGAAISAPEWNQDSFHSEKQNVKNEAKEYQDTDTRALEGAIFLNLLKKGHPLGMYHLGTQAQLDAMTMDDLKDLYYSNYRPGSEQIIVAGNFDKLSDGTVPLNTDEVLKQIEANFYPADVSKDPHGFKSISPALKQKQFPPIVSSKSYLELGTSGDQRILQAFFELNHELELRKPEVVELLLDYLNLPNKGSFTDLILKKGWITDGGFSSLQVNNLAIAQAVFKLTDLGAEHRAEILPMFFSYLHDLKKNGLSAEIIQYLKNRNVISHSQSVANAESAAETFANHLDHPIPIDEIFAFEGRYGAVTGDEVIGAIDLIFPIRKMIGGYIGPEVESKTKDTVFERPIIFPKTDIPSLERAYQKGGLTKSNASIRLAKLPLKMSSQPKALPEQSVRRVESQRPGTKIYLDEKHQYPTGALIVELSLASFSPKTEVAFGLFLATCAERFKSEVDYLSSLGIEVDLSSNHNKIFISVQGNSTASLDVAKWVLDRLFDFEPTSQEVELIREELKDTIRDHYDDFTAEIAQAAAESLLNRYDLDDAEVSKALKQVSYRDVQRLVRHKLKRANIRAVFSGDYSEGEVNGLMNYFGEKFPKKLTEKQEATLAQSEYPISNKVTFWKKLLGTKSKKALGIVRVFNGPETFTREHAALSVLQLALSDAIFSLNRTQKGLGYVHSADYSTSKAGITISLFGQTEGKKKFKEILVGWDEVIKKINDGTLSHDSFASERIGLLRTKSLIPTEQMSIVESILNGDEFSGDPKAYSKMLELIRSVTPQEIYDVGRKYLSSETYLDVVASKDKPKFLECARLLTSPKRARKAVGG